MFYYLYCKLSGEKWQRLAVMITVLILILAMIVVFVFPQLSSLLAPESSMYVA